MRYKVQEYRIWHKGNTDDTLTISVEEIKRLAIEAGLIEPEKVEKPYGELMKHRHGALKVFTSQYVAFGFDAIGYFDPTGTGYNLESDEWQPATQKDRDKFNELLLEKAESIYSVGDRVEYMGYVGEIIGEPYWATGSDTVGVLTKGSGRPNDYFGLFDRETGEWAQITISTLTHSQLEEKVGKFKYKES